MDLICREVFLNAFILKGEKIGGHGKVVEIDESKFGKRKYHREHFVEGQSVFRGFERGTGHIFIITVKDHSAKIFVPFIKK